MAWKGLFVEGVEEWSQLFQDCNWYTFHPIMLEFEDECILGGMELTFILMGLGFRLRWNYQRTDLVEELERQIEDIEAGPRP